MPRVTYWAAASMDGRVAGPNHDMAFLKTLEGTFPDDNYAMDRLLAGFDSLIMGATTFRVIRQMTETGVQATWPYGDKPAWVVTHARELPPVPGASNVRTFAGDVRQLMAQIDRGLARTWLVGGGDLAGQLLDADLIDEIILGIAPTLVGRGPALAEGALPLREFLLTDVQRSGSAVALRYERARGKASRT